MVDTSRPKIVVAEDDEAVLDLVRIRLELAGFAVTYARDGHKALEVIRAVKPAGVVLDLNMPSLDGFGVLEVLQTKQQKPPPVLVLTARNATADVKQCLALGAKDYLAKPFKDRDLIARVGRLVRKAPVLAAVQPAASLLI